ncbi:ATP-binding cassette domain-containing protein [Actinobacteria bacterium YIM 96077]|uniref:ABC transporter n=1 Tax=Phytoactinopolyspora halophila TaxID=1981511 RepID=A0A329QA89_9ACTN|nr:ATP-binding cassette domain-containing protein [Phytoactinopolyspora halophila]AYY13073.1 ATP-binding cassette domain-containing protein [Actinobacteria bacterium YIM 96077]RAW09233.1 ABC transporter [Phytoactinopolyspora halophila]
MINARNLVRRFSLKHETVEAVRGVDIDVAPGEVVAFLGPNGAGKSTTLRMLTTLLPPSDGTAIVAGHDVRREPQEVRKRIGHIGQGNGSMDGLQVREELYTQGRFYGLDRRTSWARTSELLEQLDLAEQASRDVARLSGGQRRRLDVAMGLIHRPGLVFLDEPTTGLDPQSRANLLDHIRWLREEQDITVVLTTHYLDEADAVAERVIVIDHGQIIADGTPDQLKSKVSGDLVTVTLAEPESVDAAAEVVSRIPTAHEIESRGDVVRFRTERGDAVMPELVRALDGPGLTLRGTNVQRPTLDDVFLTLTGRSLRDDE